MWIETTAFRHYARVAQLAEAGDLKSLCCEFESHLGYHFLFDNIA